jgi:uncharacterized protein YggE
MTILLVASLFAQACGGGCTQTFDKPVLSVTGQGIVVSDVKATDYTLILYADTYDADEEEARDKADMIKKEIEKAANKIGVEDEDIVLTNINVLEPIEDDPYYRIEQDIQLFLTNIDDIDKTKEKFLSIAGTSIGSVTPVIGESADYGPAVREARTKAVGNAKTEAKELADAIGVLLGEPLYVSEDIIYPTYTGYETYEETSVTVYVTMIYEMIYKK